MVISVLAMIVLYFKCIITIEDIEPYPSDSVNTQIVTTTGTTLCETTVIETTTCSEMSTTPRVTTYTTTESFTTAETTTGYILISDYSIIYIPDETTVKPDVRTTKTQPVVTIVTETTAIVPKKVMPDSVICSENFMKTFDRGTYYPGWEGYGSTQVCGGSGRLLMDCSIKDGEIKGSVSCKYIQENYGYNYNGSRTIVYLDIPELPDMSGFYFVDDSCSRDDTIDFYFTYKANCPFENQGVIKNISCYIVREEEIF